MYSKQLYADLVSASPLDNLAIQRRLSLAQRDAAMEMISAHRTVSMSVVLVLANVSRIDLLVK